MDFYIKNYTLNSTKNLQNVTIMHISDLHFNKIKDVKLLYEIANKVADTKPNMICFTGDLLEKGTVVQDIELKEILVEWLSYLGSICPIYIIRGNHDLLDNSINRWHYYDTDDFFYRLENIKNVYWLNNKSIKQENIMISGIDLGNLTEEYYTKSTESKEKFVKLVEPRIRDLATIQDDDLFNLLMIHSPRNLNEEVIRAYDVILSGHMHNGALPNFLDKIIPGNMGLLAPGKGYFPKEARGVIQYGKSMNYIAPPLVIVSKYYDKRLIKTLYKPGISYININKSH